MAYINYVVLVHFIIIIISLCYTIYASAFLLFKKPGNKQKISRTPVVLLYFCYTASASILLLIYAGYTVIGWRPDEITHNSYILYFVAGLPTIFVNLVPVADFYLCVDRCFAFASPTLFQDGSKMILAIVFFATDFSILSAYFILTKYFSFSTVDQSTTCVYYICLIWKLNYPVVMTYTKYTFCGLNLVTSIILLLLNNFRKSSKALKSFNKPVILISVINISFAFIPGLFLDLITRIIGNGVPITEYIGDTNLTCISFSIALTVHLYLRVFKKHFIKSVAVGRSAAISVFAL